MKTRRDLARHRPSIRTRTLGLALALMLGVGIVAGSGIGAPTGPATLALAQSSAIGGTTTTAVIQLAAPAPSGGAMFLLRSSDAQLASVPSMVIVPAGQTKISFGVSSQPVSSAQDVTVEAWSKSLNVKLSALLTLSPSSAGGSSPAPSLSTLSLAASSAVGGASVTGSLKLSSAAPSGGASVTLSSSNPAAASVPASVTVASGKMEANFTVSTLAVTSATALSISGSYGGATRTASLTVNPSASSAPTLSSLALNPASPTGGTSSIATVGLSAVAPTGGATVALTSTNASIAPVPATLSVPAGASIATFSIATKSVSASTAITISASYAGKSLNATLTVKPASTPPPGGGGGGANVYISSSGSDSSPCSLAAPCASLDRAYHAAKAGDKVQIAAGSYAGQTIKLDTTKLNASADVSIGPAAGAKVTLFDLGLQGSHIYIHDIAVTNAIVLGHNSVKVAQSDQAHNLTLTQVSGAEFVGNSASNVNILHSSFGPEVDSVSSIRACYKCTYMPQNWTLDDVYFHDYTRTNGGQHMECIQTYPVIGLTIRNSKFYNCSIMDLFLADGSGYCTTNVTLENNWFDKVGSHSPSLNGGYWSLLLRCRSGNQGYPMKIDVRYNSFAQNWSYDTPGGYTGTAIGNAGSTRCVPGLVCSFNVAAANFVDVPGFNLDLSAGSAAINAGNPADYPSQDIHGKTRYLGPKPDAGAQEAG